MPLQREDLGPCSKIHSEAMRGDYEKASQKADYNVEEEVSTEWRGEKGKGREGVGVEGRGGKVRDEMGIEGREGEGRDGYEREGKDCGWWSDLLYLLCLAHSHMHTHKVLVYLPVCAGAGVSGGLHQ